MWLVFFLFRFRLGFVTICEDVFESFFDVGGI